MSSLSHGSDHQSVLVVRRRLISLKLPLVVVMEAY